MSERPEENESLGLTGLPERTFEHDRAISDGYQSFSAELLRLSLLGITGIGFLVANIFFKATPRTSNTENPPISIPPGFKWFLYISLVCLGLSAACALLHRYFGSDSLAFHLSSLRLEVRKAAGDDAEANNERSKRNWRFRWSGRLLFVSGFLLWIGAVSLAISLIIVI